MGSTSAIISNPQYPLAYNWRFKFNNQPRGEKWGSSNCISKNSYIFNVLNDGGLVDVPFKGNPYT